MTIKTVIFDWDGTLVDSIEHIATSLHLAATEMGFPALEKAAYRHIIGLGMVDALKTLYPGLSDAEIEGIRQRYSQYFFAKEATPQQIFAGVPALLDELRTQGRGRAVATGKSRRGLDAALTSSGLREHFDITRCADETRSKPDPAMLLEILQFYGLEPAQAVMIGDTTYDMEMAQRIGMPAIGVRWGVHADEELQRHAPVAIVDSVVELAGVLRRL